MSILVEQQDETIDTIQETAAHVEKDTEAGTGHTTQAVSSARAARKKRWICFGISVLLLIIIAIIIAVVVLNNRKSEQSPHYVVRCALAYRLSQNKRTDDNSVVSAHSYTPTRACVVPSCSESIFSTSHGQLIHERFFSDIFHLVFLCSSVDLGFVCPICTFSRVSTHVTCRRKAPRRSHRYNSQRME